MRNNCLFPGLLLSTSLKKPIQLSCGYLTSPPKLLQSCRQFSSTHLQYLQFTFNKRSTPILRNPLIYALSKKPGRVYYNNRPNIPFYEQVRFESTASYTEKSTISSRARWLVGGLLLLWVGGSTFRLGSYSSEPKLFDPPRFTPFTITKREIVSPTSIILTLRPRLAPLNESTADLYKEWWESVIWSVEVKQPELQIARSYTPLPPTKSDENSELRFLIRKEHKGEMSGYLHSLDVGSKIELRGPHLGYDLPQDVADVVFLAGGTGIAPALQVAYTLLERRKTDGEQARIRIVWSNRRREDCEGGVGQRDNMAQQRGKQTGRIVEELENLQRRHPDQLTVDYLVDEENRFLNRRKISQITNDSQNIERDAKQPAPKLLFISGPEGFVNYFAGPKKWEDGKEGQGAVTGVLGQMRLKDWTIWKF
jgi:ferredoxin-NADP reductase